MSAQVSGAMEKDVLVIKLDGRVDSTNAPELEKEIFDLCEKNPDVKVVVDAENLEYISSAGLRVLLKLKKERKDVEVINVSNDVYEIFEVTGFVDIMKIRRRLRQFSVDGCKMIGRGGFGKVYRYDPETIIKVYRPEVQMDYIERERECSSIAFKNGLPTAIAFDVIRVGDSYGVMYELMDADNLSSVIQSNPEQEDEYVRKYAELAKMIHHTKMEKGSLQPASEMFRSSMAPMGRWLSEEEIRHYDEMINVIPERDTLIHGEFHEKNILGRGGELEMIDMGDISQGHPLVELGCIYSSHLVFAEKVVDMPAEKGKEIWEKFLKYYFGDLKEETRKRLDRVMVWVAAMRRLPFLCMSLDPETASHLGFVIDKAKEEAFIDPESIKEEFAVLDKELFSEN